MKHNLRSLIFFILIVLSASSSLATNNNSERIDFSEESNSTLYTEDFNWETGSFNRSSTEPLSQINSGEYNVTICQEIDSRETGDGTHSSLVGAYSLVPLKNGYLNMSFQGRAKADNISYVELGFRVFNPITKERIILTLDFGIQDTGVLDTGYLNRSGEVYIGEYTWVYLLVYYRDTTVENNHQEIWFRDLKFYPNDTSFLTIKDFHWTTGSFLSGSTAALESVDSGDYEVNIYSGIHGAEMGVGTYDTIVGAFALVPLNDGYLNISFQNRARANHTDAVNARVRVYHPITKVRIVIEINLGIHEPGDYDVGFLNQSGRIYVGDLNEVYLLFYYMDGWMENHHQEFWVANLEINIEIPSVTTYTISVDNHMILFLSTAVIIVLLFKSRK